MPQREAVGIIFNLLTWNKIKWSVRKIDRKRFATLCLLQKREEDKMENCYNANECKKMNVQFYLLDTNYVIWKIHGIFPELKLNRRRSVAMRLDFKEFLEHFLNFYFHLTIWFYALCIKMKLQHDKRTCSVYYPYTLTRNFCTQRSIFRLRSTQDETWFIIGLKKETKSTKPLSNDNEINLYSN